MSGAEPVSNRQVMLRWLLSVFLLNARVIVGQSDVIRGIVRDSLGAPIAQVTIEVVGTEWRTSSAQTGEFALHLAQGQWLVRASRIGYSPVELLVRIRDSVPWLQLTLVARPMSLEAMTVAAPSAELMAQTVSTATVRQVPPVGEADVFRVIVLLPGVSQPNDLKGRIHLEGGSSDETTTTLDGHPLQDPFHVLGALGAFNVAALERADVMSGHVPAAIPSRLSGVISLESRAQTGLQESEGVLSILSSSFTHMRPAGPLGVDLLASGRVSYLDKMLRLVTSKSVIKDLPLLGFKDAVIRLGRDGPADWRAEAIGFGTQDYRVVEGGAGVDGLTWGEAMSGVRLVGSGLSWRSAMRLSLNRAWLRLDTSQTSGRFIRNQRDVVSAGASYGRFGQKWSLTAGGDVDRRRFDQDWRTSELRDVLMSPHTPKAYSGTSVGTEGSFFGSLSRSESYGKATLEARATLAYGAWRIAPRATAELVRGAYRVEMSAERRYQFTAELEEPIEGNVSPPSFLLRNPRTANIGSVATERRWPQRQLGNEVVVRVEGFLKRYPDRPVLRSVTDSASFPAFDRVSARSTGLSISGRGALPGGVVAQGAYTYQTARQRTDEGWIPTVWDAPHDLSLFASLPLSRAWGLTATQRIHSGQAFTPVAYRVFVPDGALAGRFLARDIPGPTNSARVETYSRLDVGARRTWQTKHARWALVIGVVNVLARKNPLEYENGFVDAGSQGAKPIPSRGSLPLLPSIGVEVKW